MKKKITFVLSFLMISLLSHAQYLHITTANGYVLHMSVDTLSDIRVDNINPIDIKVKEMNVDGYASCLPSSGRSSCAYVRLWENGPLWAIFNVGATIDSYSGAKSFTEECIGGLYTWGGSISCDPLNKYNKYINILTYGDDTAYKLWGNKWRMPGISDINGLISNCVWEWIDGEKKQYISGCSLSGYLIKGKDKYCDKSLFLPACGGYNINNHNYQISNEGIYWTMCPYLSESATGLVFSQSSVSVINTLRRSYNYSVRPIINE